FVFSLLPRRFRPIPPAPKPDPLIVVAARRHLENIKFQHSYSSGWGGSLKLPGIEAQLNEARSFAENQRTMPQIVDDFHEFFKLMSPEDLVLIGIDELDKMESDDDVRTFLNAIKALFRIPRCFYLVSVSETAISSFERRGLPLRDVLDSTFDTIVYVDYLKLPATE